MEDALPPGISSVLEECPICGEPLENFFIDNDNNIVYIENYEITPCFLTNEGLFQLINSEENPLVDNIEWHHKHE